MDTFRRIGDPRRRLPDRAVFVAVAIIAFIGIALLKPWQSDALPAPTEVPTLGPAPSAEPTGSSEPVPAPSAVVRHDPLRWEVAAPVLTAHDDWGVRALMTEAGSGHGALSEIVVSREPALVPQATGATHTTGAIPTVALRTDGHDVVALGLTTPHPVAVIDVRFWRLGAGIPTPVAVRDLLGEPPVMDPLFVPPIGAPGDPWWPGSYRLDVLVGEGLRRIEVIIPGNAAEMPDGVAPPHLGDADIVRSVDRLPAGAFALGSVGTAASDVAGIDPAPGPALDEAGAWLDLERGGPRPGADQDPPPIVGPSVIGVLLPTEGTFETARLVRLAPWSQDLGQASLRGVTSAGRGIATFRAARGWSAGTYRIDATWLDETGMQEGSWHLDLYPLRGRGPAPILAAARYMAPAAGRWQIVDFNGWDEPLSRFSRVADVVDAPLPESIGRGCAGVPLLEAGPVLGVAHAGRQPASVEVFRRSMGGGSRPIGVAVASGLVPGIEIMRPLEGPNWQPGVYLATVDRGRSTSHVTFCLGTRDALSFLMAVPLDDDRAP